MGLTIFKKHCGNTSKFAIIVRCISPERFYNWSRPSIMFWPSLLPLLLIITRIIIVLVFSCTYFTSLFQYNRQRILVGVSKFTVTASLSLTVSHGEIKRDLAWEQCDLSQSFVISNAAVRSSTHHQSSLQMLFLLHASLKHTRDARPTKT